MKNRWLLSAAVLFSAVCANPASALERGPQYHYDKGVELYERQQYGSALAEFKKALGAMSVDDAGYRMRARYYAALCAAERQQTGAREMLERFVEDYPNSIYLNDVHFALGTILEKEGDYQRAYEHLLTVNPHELPYSRIGEYYYRTGHAAYQNGDEDKAYSYFQKCTTDPAYAPHATYYKTYIDYTRGDLDAAKSGFASIAELPAYEPIIPFYLLQIEFRQGNYAYVVEHGVPLLNKATGAREIEIARILSEAYFRQGQYADALAQIENYEKLGGEMGPEELYLAGYSNYNQLYYTKASTQLTDVASGGGELGQNAAFHLGDCYLKLGDKQKALRAFVLASASDYSPEIKREAMLNAGKLQYELGGGAFNEAITTLAGYVQAYPDSPRIDEARELLLAAYFNSRNYEAAYEAIKQVRDPDNNVKAAMQKIAYFRALEQFQKEEYPEALRMFDVADANRFNAKYSALTKFWRAETYARQGNYARAIPLYRDYIQLSPGTEYENKVAHYNLGYCYFNTQRWGDAAASFHKFLSVYPTRDNLRADAYNRLGDAAFAQRDYREAVNNYDQAIRLNAPATDYAQFQRAVMLGLLDQRDRKIESLRDIISSGKGDYVDDAMYELGRTYVQTERFNDGAAVLKRLTATYPESPYYLPALSQLGLTYQNLGNGNEALRYYKQIVAEFPSSRQAKDAMLSIRNIYVDNNDVDSYVAFARESGVETNVTMVERDSLSYTAANRVYQNGDYARALTLMDNYLRQYPKGSFRIEALYALGDCSLREGNRAGALAAFEEVGSMPMSEYKVPALQQAAKMQVEDKHYPQAAALYKTLSTVAIKSADIASALGGYLSAVLATGNVAEMGRAADEVLASPYVTADLTREANFAKARALQADGHDDEALKLYRQVAGERTREGAESRYRIVSILYKQGKLKEAEAEVFALAEQNSPYQYWTGKAFLILGDIYVQQNDAFQAKATYQSIVDGYTDKTDGVVEEARRKMNELK